MTVNGKTKTITESGDTMQNIRQGLIDIENDPSLGTGLANYGNDQMKFM